MFAAPRTYTYLSPIGSRLPKMVKSFTRFLLWRASCENEIKFSQPMLRDELRAVGRTMRQLPECGAFIGCSMYAKDNRAGLVVKLKDSASNFLQIDST